MLIKTSLYILSVMSIFLMFSGCEKETDSYDSMDLTNVNLSGEWRMIGTYCYIEGPNLVTLLKIEHDGTKVIAKSLSTNSCFYNGMTYFEGHYYEPNLWVRLYNYNLTSTSSAPQLLNLSLKSRDVMVQNINSQTTGFVLIRSTPYVE